MSFCSIKDLLRIGHTKGATVGENVHELRQASFPGKRDHFLANNFNIFCRPPLKLLWDNMCPQQCCHHCSRPSRGRVSDRFQRFDFRVYRQPISGLGLDRRRALLRHFFQGIQNFICQMFLAGFSHAVDTRANSAACLRDLFISGARNASFKIQ